MTPRWNGSFAHTPVDSCAGLSLLASHHITCLPGLPGLPADDSNAFLAAVAAASKDAKANGQGVAVLVPAGRYKITKVLVINQSYVVLRGKGVSPPTSPLLA